MSGFKFNVGEVVEATTTFRSRGHRPQTTVTVGVIVDTDFLTVTDRYQHYSTYVPIYQVEEFTNGRNIRWHRESALSIPVPAGWTSIEEGVTNS